jgi:superfamily I DNA and/or RNA helicase
MTHSLRARLGGLRHKQIISSKDYDRLCKALDNENVLDKIRAEIEKPLHDERCFDTADAKAQYIALNWCVEIIDKYRKGEIRNDNM